MAIAPSPAGGAVAPSRSSQQLWQLLADQAFSRTAGAPLVTGNRVDLLLDARENYPAWKQAIAKLGIDPGQLASVGGHA